MKKRTVSLISLLLILCLFAAGMPGTAFAQSIAASQVRERVLAYRLADAEEGAALLLANKAYYDGFSQNDLEYRMQKTDTDIDEYKAFAREQVRDFTDPERELIESCFLEMENTLAENGYILPPLEEIVFIKTTMAEECNVGGYTHGTQIYMSEDILDDAVGNSEGALEYLKTFFWHELFHCLTRCNPDFRADMYHIIHFTVQDEDFPLPPSVFEYHISNPDVEHHNSWASFLIEGKELRCFTDFVTTRHFEKPGDRFFDYATTALVPIDGSDRYYTPEQASNFDEVFGRNTDYVVDPEECMADNFSYAMAFGLDGPNGDGYPNPEIIEAILAALKG